MFNMIFHIAMILGVNCFCPIVIIGIRKRNSYVHRSFVEDIAHETILRTEKQYKSITDIINNYDTTELNKIYGIYRQRAFIISTLIWVMGTLFSISNIITTLQTN